jgi:hypothetical protein
MMGIARSVTMTSGSLAEDIDLDALDAVELAELIVVGVRAKLAA